MKIIFSFLWLFSLSVCKGQSYDSLSAAAFKEYGMQNFKLAASLYENLVNKFDSVKFDDYYNAACVNSMVGDREKAFSYLNLLVEKGYKDVVWITKDGDLNNLHKDKRWQSIIEKIKLNYDNYEKQYDRELRKQIFQMVDFDQELRKKWGEIEKEFGKNSVQYDSLGKIVDQYRDKHTKEIELIYSDRGFPTQKVIGKDAVYNIWVLALHSLDVQFQKLSLFYLTEEANQGGIDWEQIAMLSDRISFNEKEPQLFGTRFDVVDMSKRQVKLYPVKDIKNLDKRRTLIHLKPVKEAYSQWGYDLLDVPEQNK